MDPKASHCRMSSRFRYMEVSLLLVVACLDMSCERRQEMSITFEDGYFLLNLKLYEFKNSSLRQAPNHLTERFSFRAYDPTLDSTHQHLYFSVNPSFSSDFSIPSQDFYVFSYDLSQADSEPLLLTQGTRPKLSPDGESVAFVRNGTEIWARDVSSGVERRLISDLRINITPYSWISDQQIIYMNESSELVIGDIASGDVEATGHVNACPVASDSLTKRVICVEEEGGRILEYDPESNEIRTVFKARRPGLSLVWAPDSSGFFMTSYHSVPRWKILRDNPDLHFFTLDGKSIKVRQFGYLHGGAFLPQDLFSAGDPE